MIRASRALHDDFEAFKTVYERNVSVEVAPEEVLKIWQQESVSGGFAVNGELSLSHWQDEMRLFFELNPELVQVSRSDVISESFVGEALKTLGSVEGPDLN